MELRYGKMDTIGILCFNVQSKKKNCPPYKGVDLYSTPTSYQSLYMIQWAGRGQVGFVVDLL